MNVLNAPALPSVSERLSSFIQRYNLEVSDVAEDIGVPEEDVRHFISPTAKSSLGVCGNKIEAAVRDWMNNFTFTTLLKRTPSSCYKSLVQSHLKAGFQSTTIKGMKNTGSENAVVKYYVSRRQHYCDINQQIANRKRKREIYLKELSDLTNHGNRRFERTSTFCPVRIDIDYNGIRFQDSFQLDLSIHDISPENISSNIVKDEQLPDDMNDLLSETIRRQLLNHNHCMFSASISESLHPISLDLAIEGVMLQDKFEWNVNDSVNNVVAFARGVKLCMDLNLPVPFESAIILSMNEQIQAYRSAVHFRWISTHEEYLTQNLSQNSRVKAHVPILPILTCSTAIRSKIERCVWHPILSELSTEEMDALHRRWNVIRSSHSQKLWSMPLSNSQLSKRGPKSVLKDSKGPRAINPFLMFCQVQKDVVSYQCKSRRSAAETRKILGDMWRKCSDQEKEHYTQLADVENEKRRREHILDIRDKTISEWEEEEVRRKGILGTDVLEINADYCRGLLLEDYIGERHEVEATREAKT